MPSHRKPSIYPAPEPKVLHPRLESLRQALGASRLAVARRLLMHSSNDGVGPFQVLAAVDADGPISPAEGAVPLSAFLRLLREGRPLELHMGQSDPIVRELPDFGARQLRAWPLPFDRRPTVLMVALYRSLRAVGAARLGVAVSGMEALARGLTPPTWLPLAPVPAARTPSDASNASELPPFLRGSSEAVVALRRRLSRLATANAPTLVEGEAGSGRLSLVEYLRSQAEQGNGPLRRLRAEELDLDALHEELRAAEKSPHSLLIEDPAALDGAQQAALNEWLRRHNRPLPPPSPGDASESPFRGRLFTFSGGRLLRAVEEGRLRSDLYWQLAELRVQLPALRERRIDLVTLLVGYLQQTPQWGSDPPEFEPAARRAVECCSWPGNLPQLQREARRLATLFPGCRRIRRVMLSSAVLDGISPPVENRREGLARLDRLLPLDEAVAVVEKLMIRRALQMAEGNKTLAARRLRVSRQGLYKKLKHHGLR